MKQFPSNHEAEIWTVNITRIRIPIFIFNCTQKLLYFLQNLCHVKACQILIKPVLNYGLCQQDGFHPTKPGRPEDGNSIVLWNIGTHLHKNPQDPKVWIFTAVGTSNPTLLLLLMALQNIWYMVKLTALNYPPPCRKLFSGIWGHVDW
jgi:hypothetical protein